MSIVRVFGAYMWKMLHPSTVLGFKYFLSRQVHYIFKLTNTYLQAREHSNLVYKKNEKEKEMRVFFGYLCETKTRSSSPKRKVIGC